jgi:N-acetylmuramoyl-L-alanine amidase
MKIVAKPSPNHSSREGHRISMVIIHGDAGKSDAGTVAWVQNPESKISYHYLVGRDGTVYRFVAESEKAWHAGVSAFHGEEIGNSVNPTSIGVALANDGLGGEAYRPIQYEVAAELVQDICKRHGIPLHRVRSHADVSPGRKTDPWKWFDWQTFYCAFGRFARAAA